MFNREEAVAASLSYFDGDTLAANVFVDKYALKDNEGNVLESTPEAMHERLAREFARIEAKYPNPRSYEEIMEHISGFKYIVPQGSPMEGIGNNHRITSLSNCYVIEGPEDSYGGIFRADQQEAQLMKRRGGVGMDISNIRPKGLVTNNAAKTTDGIAVFMDRFSNTCREVAQNGRRGALMLTIDVRHPEVETFINIKREKNRVTGANISVKMTDDFMRAVKSDEEYTQMWPINSPNPTVIRKVKARTIWNQIIHAAWESAEPGILFWDNATQNTPSDIYTAQGFGSVSTNPCLVGDTQVATEDGEYTIKYMSENSDQFIGKNIWSYNVETGKKELDVIANCFLTKENAKVIELEFDDDTIIKLTPDHRVFTKNRGYVEAQFLTESDDIVSY